MPFVYTPNEPQCDGCQQACACSVTFIVLSLLVHSVNVTLRMYSLLHVTHSSCVQEKMLYEEANAPAIIAAVEEAAVHEDNDWGIEVIDDTALVTTESTANQRQSDKALPEGLQYELPAATRVDAEVLSAAAVQTGDANVDDLMAQLQQLSST